MIIWYEWTKFWYSLYALTYFRLSIVIGITFTICFSSIWTFWHVSRFGESKKNISYYHCIMCIFIYQFIWRIYAIFVKKYWVSIFTKAVIKEIVSKNKLCVKFLKIFIWVKCNNFVKCIFCNLYMILCMLF